MKMKKLLLLLLFPFVLFACGSDDDDNNDNGNGNGNGNGNPTFSIVGTWIEQPSTDKEVITNNEKATKAIKRDIAKYEDPSTIVFTQKGKITVKGSEGEGSGTYTLEGNKLSYTFPGQEKTSIYIYNITDNTFSYDEDYTKEYQDVIYDLVPNEKNVVVSKVIITQNYKRE